MGFGNCSFTNCIFFQNQVRIENEEYQDDQDTDSVSVTTSCLARLENLQLNSNQAIAEIPADDDSFQAGLRSSTFKAAFRGPFASCVFENVCMRLCVSQLKLKFILSSIQFEIAEYRTGPRFKHSRVGYSRDVDRHLE